MRKIKPIGIRAPKFSALDGFKLEKDAAGHINGGCRQRLAPAVPACVACLSETASLEIPA